MTTQYFYWLRENAWVCIAQAMAHCCVGFCLNVDSQWYFRALHAVIGICPADNIQSNHPMISKRMKNVYFFPSRLVVVVRCCCGAPR